MAHRRRRRWRPIRRPLDAAVRSSERFVRGRLEVDGTATLWLDVRAING
ncbi:hypothetical protein ACFOZ7_20855 [Natribaculum luteum]|uniref:Uncharacterized protein n=1 Tax=Natribaculum luteum TaxID=1586232 RepID=A0ABD5P612_9EURY|nr:hypothetical protein [Natribaculum luteum]